MPSPSKIPLPTKSLRTYNKKDKIHCRIKEESAEKVCSLKGQENLKPSKMKPVPSKIVGISQSSRKMSSISKISKNTPKSFQQVRKPAKVGDRRGVSEIKRSEQSLREKVTKLKDEVQEMQTLLGEYKQRCDVSEQLLDTLKQEKSELIARNDRLGQILEKENINPVSGNQMKFSSSFESRVESQAADNANIIDVIIASIKGLNNSLDDAASTTLNTIVVPTLEEQNSSFVETVSV